MGELKGCQEFITLPGRLLGGDDAHNHDSEYNDALARIEDHDII